MATYNRLQTLVAMQLTNRKMFKKMKSKMHAVAYVLLRVLVIAVITAIIAGVMMICNSLLQIKVDRNLLLFIIAFSQIISIIGFTNGLVNSLYLSKDNAILLQFPARHSEIFISKMVVNYIVEFWRNLNFILPLLLAFGIMGQTPVDVGYWLTIPLFLVFLPLIPLFLGAILSIPLMYAKRLLNSIPLLHTFVGLSFLGLVIYWVIKIVALIPTPLRLLANYNSFITGFNQFIVDANSFFIGYQNIVNCLFDTRTVWDFLILIGTGAVIVALAYFLAMPLFFKIISHFSERSVDNKHKKHTNKQRGVFGSYFIKEITTIMRTPGKLFSFLFGVVTLPFLLYVINTIFTAINTSAVGDSMIIGFNLMIGLFLAAANNSSAAESISREGAEFAVLKTAPSQTYKMVWSKVLVYEIFNIISLIFGFAVLASITDLSASEVVWLFLVFILISSGHLLWSVQFDILNPRLNDVASKGTAYNNPNVGKSILAGLLTAVIFCAVTIFFMVDSYVGGWVKLILFAVAFFVVRLALFMANLRVYFKRIEF